MTDAGLKPRRIKRIAVLGGGLMGSGIATASVLAGVEVLLKEINDKFLQARPRRPGQALSLGVMMETHSQATQRDGLYACCMLAAPHMLSPRAKPRRAGHRRALREESRRRAALWAPAGPPARRAPVPCVSAGPAAQAGLKRVEANVMSRVKKGKMKEAAAKAALGLLTGTLTYDDFGSVDMVRACSRGAPQPRCRMRRARPHAWSTAAAGLHVRAAPRRRAVAA